MNAIILEKYGPASEVLQLESIPVPKIEKPNELIVQIHYAGTNPGDYKLRSGFLQNVSPKKLPTILGFDYSGTITSVHPDHPMDSPYQAGTKVYGKTFEGGCYAQFVKVDLKAKNEFIAPLPENVPMEEAAGVSAAAFTAYAALTLYGGLKPPSTLPLTKVDTSNAKKVLIIGASGGVGHVAVQIAKSFGLYTVGVCSTKNVDFVTSIGADKVIDYTQGALSDQLRAQKLTSLDLVLDFVGGDEYHALFPFIKSSGSFVTSAGSSVLARNKDPVLPKSALFSFLGFMGKRKLLSVFGSAGYQFVMDIHAKEVRQGVKELYEKGLFKITVAGVHDLIDVAKAHADLETGRTVGKIVLKCID